MKEKELREIVDCGICGEKFGKSGMPSFVRLRIERHGLNVDAVKRQSGFETMMGAQLGMIMGMDEDMTTVITEPKTITVCEDCVVTTTILANLLDD